MASNVDFFLKLESPNVLGESMDSTHQGEIDVLSWSWGESQTGTMFQGGGGGVGKINMQDFHFTMYVNKAMPTLMQYCASGQQISKGTLTCRKAGTDTPQEYLKIYFTELLVSSYQTGGSGGGTLPVDSISLNYSSIQFEYKEQNPDGSVGNPVKAGWNLKLNKKM